MRINFIEFKNFASYGNQLQRIEFEEDQSKLFLTLGKNGDGKTTIANAIIYALYGRVEGVKLADLPNRINKELQVKIGLTCGNIEVEIERGCCVDICVVCSKKLRWWINSARIGLLQIAQCGCRSACFSRMTIYKKHCKNTFHFYYTHILLYTNIKKYKSNNKILSISKWKFQLKFCWD